MRGDRIIEGQDWNYPGWAYLPGGRRPHRVRYWLAEDWDTKTFRLSAVPDGDVIGMEVQHLREDNGLWCGGYISTGTPVSQHFLEQQSGHQLIAIEPLHLEASLGCRGKGCTSHGWVRGGVWIDC